MKREGEIFGIPVWTDPSFPPDRMIGLDPRLMIVNGVPLAVALAIMELRWWP